jgi:hypothetical protein
METTSAIVKQENGRYLVNWPQHCSESDFMKQQPLDRIKKDWQEKGYCVVQDLVPTDIIPIY